MPEYYAVFTRGRTESSDSPFAEELKPTESSKILGPVLDTTAVLLEAANEEEAARAARVAYPGRANTKMVIVPKANWKEI